jgi:hypothetical protein
MTKFFYVIHEDLVPTPQKILRDSIEKSSQFMVCREIVPVCCENQTKKINKLCGHNAGCIVLNWRYLYSVSESNELEQRIIYCRSIRYVL